MKITDVRCVILRAPLVTPIRMAHGTLHARTMALVEIETDEGVIGIGESWTNFPPWAAEERRLTVEQGVRPLLLGQDALDRAGRACHATPAGSDPPTLPPRRGGRSRRAFGR